MQIRPDETYNEYVARLRRRVSELERQRTLTPSIERQSVIGAELEVLRAELTELGEVADMGR